MCQRCEELEERVAWLESELGLQRDADVEARMLAAFPHQAGVPYHPSRRGALRALLALYQAKGRPVTHLQILEAVPPANGGDDERTSNLVATWVCVARRIVGRDAIESVWGKGYRLTPTGLARVSAALEADRVAA